MNWKTIDKILNGMELIAFILLVIIVIIHQNFAALVIFIVLEWYEIHGIRVKITQKVPEKKLIRNLYKMCIHILIIFVIAIIWNKIIQAISIFRLM